MTEITSSSSSAADQRKRLLERLHQGPIDTIEARSVLNVMHPAARIQELRNAGHRIQTHRKAIYDEKGRKHSAVAVYYLSPSAAAQAAA